MSSKLAVRIYLEDTDAGGIVYHASYFRFMERARTEALRRSGLEQSRTFEQRLSFVVHSMNVRFLAPARLDDEVEVSCEVERLQGASVTFQQEVRSLRTSQLHCQAQVVVACIDLDTQRPRRIPKPMQGALAAPALLSSTTTSKPE